MKKKRNIGKIYAGVLLTVIMFCIPSVSATMTPINQSGVTGTVVYTPPGNGVSVGVSTRTLEGSWSYPTYIGISDLRDKTFVLTDDLYGIQIVSCYYKTGTSHVQHVVIDVQIWGRVRNQPQDFYQPITMTIDAMWDGNGGNMMLLIPIAVNINVEYLTQIYCDIHETIDGQTFWTSVAYYPTPLYIPPGSPPKIPVIEAEHSVRTNVLVVT